MIDANATAERRRKKQKDGEEDPISVAQRFLNIYRQLHIFSDDKKDAFNKMLLELPIEVKNAFGSLPGGSMVQDYIYDLEDTLGMEEETFTTPQPEENKSNILQAALAESADAEIPSAEKVKAAPQIQPQAQFQPAQQIITTMAPSKLELGGNFASELASALGSVLKDTRQPAAVAGNIETSAKVELGKDFASDLAEAMATAMKNSFPLKEETSSESPKLASDFGKELGENLSQSLASALKETSQFSNTELKQLLETMEKNHGQVIEMLRQDSSQNRTEMQNLTQMVIRGQMHLAKVVAGSKASFDEEDGDEKESKILESLNSTQQLIAKALISLSQAQKKDTDELTQTLVKSQQEMLKVMLQNNTASSANNANNIQINTPDSSAQLHLIVDKLADMQTVNTKSFEQMMEKMVQTQSELYRNIAETQTKELSAIITLALKETQKASAENIITALGNLPVREAVPMPIYYPQPPQNFAQPSEMSMTENSPFYPQYNAPYSQEQDIPAQEETIQPLYSDEVQAPSFDIAYDAPSDEENLPFENNTFDIQEPDNITFNNDDILSDENVSRKKKKKKKKKNKNSEDISTFSAPDIEEQPKRTKNMWLDDEEDESSSVTEETLPVVEETLPESSSFVDAQPDNDENNSIPETEESEKQEKPKHIWDIDLPELADNQDINLDDLPSVEPLELNDSSDDWGWTSVNEPQKEDKNIEISSLSDASESFVSSEMTTDNSSLNDDEVYGEEGQDWVWDYEEEPANDDYIPQEASFATANLKPLGNYNFLCSGDLYFQKDVFKKLEQNKVDLDLFDAGAQISLKNLISADENDDPYKNSDSKD